MNVEDVVRDFGAGAFEIAEVDSRAGAGDDRLGEARQGVVLGK